MQLAMTDVRHEFDGGQGMTSAPLCDDVSGDGNVGRAEAHTMRACVQAISPADTAWCPMPNRMGGGGHAMHTCGLSACRGAGGGGCL